MLGVPTDLTCRRSSKLMVPLSLLFGAAVALIPFRAREHPLRSQAQGERTRDLFLKFRPQTFDYVVSSSSSSSSIAASRRPGLSFCTRLIGFLEHLRSTAWSARIVESVRVYSLGSFKPGCACTRVFCRALRLCQVFCAPPTGNEHYAEDVAAAARWFTKAMVFTSSCSV